MKKLSNEKEGTLQYRDLEWWKNDFAQIVVHSRIGETKKDYRKQ